MEKENKNEYWKRYRREHPEKEKARVRRRIELKGTTFEKWNEVKGDMKNDDFAILLLETYEDHSGSFTAVAGHQMDQDDAQSETRSDSDIPMLTSTPLKDPSNVHEMRAEGPILPSTSTESRPDVSTASQERATLDEQVELSESCQNLESTASQENATLEEQVALSESCQNLESTASQERATLEEQVDLSESCQNLDISVNYTVKGDFVYPSETLSEVDESEFSEAEPSFQMGPPCDSNLEVIGQLNEVLGAGLEEDEEVHVEQEQEGPTTKSGLHRKMVAEEALGTKFYIISESRLLDLARRSAGTCPKCSLPETSFVRQCRGSAGHVSWSCPNGHRRTWCSQETVNNSHVGDLKMASAILFSGNNVQKVAIMCRFMNLHMMAQSTFYVIQRRYVCQAVEANWKDVQADTLQRHSQKPVVLCGDGRNDSPGHCAQYLTYTFLEHDSQDIIHCIIKDKRQAANSGAMEPMAFKEGLCEIEGMGLSVTEVVTDAHSSIAKFMREQRPDVKHSWDIWHGAKNLGKRLSKVSGKAANRPLLYWIRHVLNHFWHCARNCDGSLQSLKARWHGLTHHVTNKHTWVSGMGGQVSCDHDPITEDREEWLAPGGSPHRALVEVAYDRRFIGNMNYYSNFRHTSMLESIHNHILMYSSKRFSFNYQAYRARNLLAMLDFMAHKDRAYQVNAEGDIKYVRVWSKHAANYVARPVKVAKTYPYIPDLMRSVLTMRESDHVPLFSKAEMLPTDPRHIRASLAPYPAPALDEIIARKKGRINPGITARI